MPNRLANETSPYLLQHANNPVNWYPWGEEALERSRSLDKPILLSIGYSACHWCHVMEHESFENPRIADIMNEHFVSIKVDREERPDLDSIYMEAVQAMTGRGGWPMTVFLTPDLRPFYGGTYFPPQDRLGMPGFARVLVSVAKTFQESKDEVAESADAITEHIQHERNTSLEGEVNSDNLARAYSGIAARFDAAEGGFGDAPKFPPAVSLEFLLRIHLRGENTAPLTMVEKTLTKMAYGGIYDQLGGGFHRYSVDDRWLVPHFEKMLYDNALLSLVYLHGWQATGNSLYRRITRETLDYVLREMTSPEGGFYSSQDADSEGHEGLFYTWTADEIRSILPDSSAFERYYGVTDEGNFEGRNILNVPVAPDTVASELGLALPELESQLDEAKKLLLAARGERVWPGRDDKALAGWNGLMLRAFAEAAAGLEDSTYLDAARRNGDFLLTHMRRGHRMLRTYKNGGSKLNGYLEDQAYVASGLLALFEADFDPHWLSAACELADEAIEHYWSEDDATFYETSSDHERLLVRPRSFADNATPAAAGVMTEVLLRLSRLTGRQQYEEVALRVLATSQTAFIRYPSGFASYLCAQDFVLGDPVEVAIAGSLEDSRTQDLIRAVRDGYRPHQVVAAGEPGADFGPAAPLMEGRSLVNEQPAAYVCRGYTCGLPIQDPQGFRVALSRR